MSAEMFYRYWGENPQYLGGYESDRFSIEYNNLSLNNNKYSGSAEFAISADDLYDLEMLEIGDNATIIGGDENGSIKTTSTVERDLLLLFENAPRTKPPQWQIRKRAIKSKKKPKSKKKSKKKTKLLSSAK